ncbi:MAG: ABC transporter ATP-binding protein [Deltaproteobacteria bacterium]|nr:MAG: ABC transporter ATP-binding protein [Deltaproteobacteria bacterium]
MPAAIEVEHLTRVWPQPKGPPVVAVHDASFSVEGGEVLGLLGPNGAGKTTLMQVLATLTTPDEGRVRVAGFDVVEDPRAVRRHLGYLSTTSGLPARLTCRECLVLFARLHELPDPRAAAEAAIARFRLGDFGDRFVEGLSTGMRQRVRIACASVHRPPVLILDEPTAGLDLMSTDDLLREVVGLRDEGAAVLYSTHLMHEVDRICDRVAVLYQGRLLVVDTLDGLRASTGTADLAEAFRRVVGSQGLS